VENDEGDDGSDDSALGPMPSLEELVHVYRRGGGVSVGFIEPAESSEPMDDVPWDQDPLVQRGYYVCFRGYQMSSWGGCNVTSRELVTTVT